MGRIDETGNSRMGGTLPEPASVLIFAAPLGRTGLTRRGVSSRLGRGYLQLVTSKGRFS